MNVIRFSAGDALLMKKPHPCGSNRMLVLRTGSDIRIKCAGCGREVTVARVKLEKSVREVEKNEETV